MAKSPKPPRPDPNNSEKELIALLKTVIVDIFDEYTQKLNEVVTQQLKIMTALETLTDSVNKNTTGQAALTTAVNAAIVRIGTPGATDAQLLSLAAAIDQSTASDASLTSALNDALAATPPTPPTQG